MEKLFDRMINYMLEEGKIEEEDKAVYLFALRTILVYAGNIVLSVLIGFLMRMPVYCVIFLLSFMILRQEAGGYHAPGWGLCNFLSCVVLVITLGTLKISFEYKLQIMIALSIISTLGIIVYAPLEDHNRVLEERDRRVIRKRAQKIVLAELVLGIVLIRYEERAAYAILSAVIWCGVSYLAWFIKKYAGKDEKIRKKEC